MDYQINLDKVTIRDIRRFASGEPITGAELKEFLDRVVVGGVTGMSLSETRNMIDKVIKETRKLQK